MSRLSSPSGTLAYEHDSQHLVPVAVRTRSSVGGSSADCAHRVSDTVRLFLRGQWRNGALFGRTEEQAYFVTCDETTMTKDDILNGRLVCEIGIAPVRPAEFVIFRIFQNTADAQK